jgi:hypothetical protein
VTGAGPDEPAPQEREAAYEAAWEAHPLRNHPRFRLATPEERAADEHVLLTFLASPGWVPGAKRTPRA